MNINEHGDIRCINPECGANIMTPDGKEVVEGLGQCGLCKNWFLVTAKEAEIANERAAAKRKENDDAQEG